MVLWGMRTQVDNLHGLTEHGCEQQLMVLSSCVGTMQQA